MELVKPMKAPSRSCHMLPGNENLSKLEFPLLASYKIDGVRCAIQTNPDNHNEYVAYSNSLKPLPNKFLQRFVNDLSEELGGLDGELVVGPPNAPDVFRKTMSAIMSVEGDPDFTFYVFDDCQIALSTDNYAVRLEILQDWFKTHCIARKTTRLVILEQRRIKNIQELLAFEQEALALGYEGLMLRNPEGFYKPGPNRTTIKGQELLKLKRFCDSEAEILEVLEGSINTNEAKVNELGRSKRSSHKAGKVSSGMLGSIVAKDVNTNAVITIGPGKLTHEERRQWWENRDKLLGKFVTYKYFPSGSKDLPRFPTCVGLRDPLDMGKF